MGTRERRHLAVKHWRAGARIRGRDDTLQKTDIDSSAMVSKIKFFLQVVVMVMVLPSLVLLIDAFDDISIMYLSMETRHPRPDTMVKRRQSLIFFRAPKTRSSSVVAACSSSPRPMELVW